MAVASMSSTSFDGEKPPVNPWFIAFAVMLATFMEVLDTSVANVALNHIAGNLSASTDEATWVLTSYLVSNAIVLAGDWLAEPILWSEKVSDHLHRDLYDFVRSLRFSQQPRDADSGANRPRRWGRSASTDCASGSSGKFSTGKTGFRNVSVRDRRRGCADPGTDDWRMVNRQLLVALGVLYQYSYRNFGGHSLLHSAGRPGLPQRRATWQDRFCGVRLVDRLDRMSSGLARQRAGRRLALFKFNSNPGLYSVVGFCVFIIWELRVEHPIVNLRILGNRNLAIGSLLLFLVGAILYGTTAILPLFCKTFFLTPPTVPGW